MFGAVSFVIYGDERFKTMMREKCLDYIYANKDYFKEFIDLGKFASIDHYCEYKKKDGIWGDDIEL